MSNKNITDFIIPEAITREDHYIKFLSMGGDINLLPNPITRKDKFLYALCLVKAGISITRYPYYKAMVNSDSGAYNFIGGFYDLGENKKTTNAKVKFRFTLRNIGNDIPKSVGLALLADNEATQFVGNEYNLQIPNKIQAPKFDEEYTIEGDYLAVNADKNLNAYRYIRPYIRIDKTNAIKTSTHGIDIHEIILTIDGNDYDITNTTRVFGPVQDGESKVEFIEGPETGSKEEVKIVREYVKAVLNSGSVGQNYFSVMHDLGETERLTEAKFECRFTLRNTGNDKPESIGVKLFANNDSNRDVISDYTLDIPSLINVPEYDKEYKIEANYTETSGDKNLNAFRYLKPFVVLNKANKIQTSIHAIDIHEAKLTISDKTYDLTNTVKDFAPVEGGGSKVQIVKEEIKLPYAGEIFAALGTSITYGYDPKNGGKKLANAWPEQLKDLCRFSKSLNYGISSSTVATKSTDPNWNSVRNPMCLRYTQMDNNAKVITVECGTNDHTQNVPLGENSISNKNTDTFYGALNVLYEGLKNKYPDSLIIAIPMLYYSLDTNTNGNTVDQFRQATIDMATHHKLKIFDLQKVVSFNVKENKNVEEKISDRVHPTQSGADEIAIKAAEDINKK